MMSRNPSLKKGVVAVFLALSVVAGTAAEDAPAAPLPVTRVALFSSGVVFPA